MLLSLFLSWTSRQGSRLEHRLVDDHDALTTALQFDFSIATFTGWDLSGPFRSICVCVSLWFSLCIGHLTLAFAFAWSRKALIYSRPPLCDLDISGLSTLCVTISCACWLSFLLFCFSRCFWESCGIHRSTFSTKRGRRYGFAFVTPFGSVGRVFSSFPLPLRVLFPMLLGPWRYYLLTKLGFILLRYGFWGITPLCLRAGLVSLQRSKN